MGKQALDDTLRNRYLDIITNTFKTQLDSDVLAVSSSEVTIPCVDEEGNEKWVLIKVSVPRGTRNGEGGYEPYDGYAAADAYAEDLEEKTRKKEAANAKKQAKIAKDEAKRAEKKALAEANKGLKELRNIKDESPQSLEQV